ncbi:MAG: SurA N-terminal domain-containing protein, partial [Candidatus Lambdaproteobacteria bacterium]|nr:SurA N-terminal domain-containing protein [Candidatus Lambdaproteobacteria bacterium]
MITFLRRHAQSWFIKILLSIIVVTFIISFGIGTFSNPKEVLVKIGRHEVLVQEYMDAYQRELERLKERFPGNAEELAKQINLRRQVYENLVNRRLILLSAPGRGLIATDTEVRAAVRSQPGFQAGGRFDANVYATVLRQNGMTPFIYEGRVREDLVVQKFQRNLFAGVVVGEPEVERRFRINNEKVSVDYVYVDPARFVRTATVSDDELKTYYDAHQEQFRQPLQYKLRFFVLGTRTLLPQVELRERAVERFYERNRDTRFTKLGRVRARHILKKFPADGTPEQEQAITRDLAGLRAQTMSGADFGGLARKHSEDASAAKGGDLGFFEHDEMLPGFADAAFAMEPGQISDVVRTQFGFHLIQVLEREPKVVRPLEAVRAEIEADLKNERAERKLDLEAERAPQRMEKDGIEAAAKEFGAALQSTDWFDGTGELPGIGSAAALYGQLRNAAVGHAGVLRRNPVQGHVFFQVAERKDAFVKPLEAVRQQAAEQVRAQKGAQAAQE